MANEKGLIDVSDWDFFYADMGDSRNTMDSYDRDYTDALDRADDWMDAQPTVDAVEVVRCKDCIHWLNCQVKPNDGTYRDYLPGETFGDVSMDTGINIASHCTLHGNKDRSGSWFWSRPDDYCSRGERRTE